MRKDLIIPALDLAQSVTEALSRGRYVLMTDGEGRAKEITLDLVERDDDQFGEPEFPDTPEHAVAHDKRVRRFTLDALSGASDDPPVFSYTATGFSHPSEVYSDDHGASIPAQIANRCRFSDFADGVASRMESPGGDVVRTDAGVIVYEFALQDVWEKTDDPVPEFLHHVNITDAPDPGAAEGADWVHVYDRVTRERRTLKRPEPDAVLKGLRDVAADLRKPKLVEPEPGFVADRILTESGAWIHVNRPADAPKRGDPVEPPFGCAAVPPVGPLTSTDGLRPGDVLFHPDPDFGVVRMDGGTHWGRMVGVHSVDIPERGLTADFTEFRFVGRPDDDRWMTWAGGENPVPGRMVEVDFRDGTRDSRVTSDGWTWTHFGDHPRDIVRFRLVDTSA